MCFAPQRRALFRHLNFQKWSDHGVLCTFWLGNVLRATTACICSSLIWPDGSAPAALASLLFDPGPQIIEEIGRAATFLPFHAPASSFFWLFLFSDLLFLLFSSLTRPTSAFPSLHTVGSLISKLPSTISITMIFCSHLWPISLVFIRVAASHSLDDLEKLWKAHQATASISNFDQFRTFWVCHARFQTASRARIRTKHILIYFVQATMYSQTTSNIHQTPLPVGWCWMVFERGFNVSTVQYIFHHITFRNILDDLRVLEDQTHQIPRFACVMCYPMKPFAGASRGSQQRAPELHGDMTWRDVTQHDLTWPTGHQHGFQMFRRTLCKSCCHAKIWLPYVATLLVAHLGFNFVAGCF